MVPDSTGLYANGNRIRQRTCDGSPQQQWFLQVQLWHCSGAQNIAQHYTLH